MSVTAAGSRQYATFYVGGQFFGIDVLEVQEVLRQLDMTSVPLAPAVVRGLINLRGQIVTALDMRRRLGLPDRAAEAKPINVVIRSGDEAVSLMVDEIGDVLDVGPECFEPPPESIPQHHRELIEGIYKLENRLLLVLDLERLLEVQARGSEQRGEV